MYLAAKQLAGALSGKRLTRGELRHPRLAEHDFSGRTVLGVHSVGKHLFTRFDDGRSLHTHFLLHDMALLATRDEHRLVGDLGPDLLNPGWDDNDSVLVRAAVGWFSDSGVRR